MGSPLKILVIDDVAADFQLVERYLRQHGPAAECRHISRDAELDAVLDADWDLVLSDYSMPGMDFRNALQRIKARQAELPVIMVSGSVGEETAVDLLRLGLTDFVLKDHLIRLPAAIQRALDEVAEHRARQKAEQALREEQAAAVEAQRKGRLAALNLMEDAITARTRAEVAMAALQESEERLTLALQAANQGTYDINLQTGEVVVSPEYATMLGYDPAGFHETRAAWIERMHPDDRERVVQTYRDYLAGKTTEFRVEFRQQARSGDWKWLLSLGRVVTRDAAGKALRMLGTHTDITEHKRAEAERQALEARYRDLFDANPHPMWVYDLETLAFLAVNDAAVTHYGYSRAEFLAMTIKDIRPQDEVPAMLTAVGQIGDGLNEAGVWQHRKKDGGVILVEIASHPLDFGGHGARAVLAHDVTQAKQIEAALRKSEQMFRSLFDNNMDAVLLTTPEGDILAANHEAQLMFGRSEEELRTVGRASVVDVSDPRLSEAMVERSKTGRFRGELTLVGAQGRKFPAEISSMVFTSIDGRPMTSMIARDITERKRVAEKDQQQIRELRQWYELTLGRESRVLDLKTEVNALLRELGQEPRYFSVETADFAGDASAAAKPLKPPSGG